MFWCDGTASRMKWGNDQVKYRQFSNEKFVREGEDKRLEGSTDQGNFLKTK